MGGVIKCNCGESLFVGTGQCSEARRMWIPPVKYNYIREITEVVSGNLSDRCPKCETILVGLRVISED